MQSRGNMMQYCRFCYFVPSTYKLRLFVWNVIYTASVDASSRERGAKTILILVLTNT